MQNSILIIDDDIGLCHLLKRCVEKESLTANLAPTGTTGLDLAVKGSYQLIILDVMLPEMDGFQVLEKIRGMRAVPVLMLTAKLPAPIKKTDCAQVRTTI
jgi:DNA-binding response OmpR family regulator